MRWNGSGTRSNEPRTSGNDSGTSGTRPRTARNGRERLKSGNWTAADESETAVEQVFTNEPAQLAFLMPADASGPYVVLIRRRHPRGHGPLLEGKLSEPIVPA